jgi:hypothetical protein
MQAVYGSLDTHQFISAAATSWAAIALAYAM